MDDSIFLQYKDLLASLIAENNEIGIIIGQPLNLDKIAGALSLYLSLKEAGKNVQVACIQEPTVEFSNLVGIDKITKSFSGDVKTLTISLPYNEEIGKVSYKIENDKLNINLFADEGKYITILERDIEYLKKGSAPSLIVTVGLSSLDKVSNLLSSENNARIINIDINDQNQSYGDIALISSSFSSISEVVTKMLNNLVLPINIDIAQNLLDGISSSTNNFSSYNASPFAFEAASFLMRNGARRRSLRTNFDKNRKPAFNTPRMNNQPSVHGVSANVPNKFHPVSAIKRSVNRPDVKEDYNIMSTSSGSLANDNNTKEEINDFDKVPEDWFTPKVFKGAKKQDE